MKKNLAAAIGAIALTAIGVVPVNAQVLNVRAGLTSAELETFAGDAGAMLRMPQLVDAATLGAGHTDIAVDYASARKNDWAMTRIVARHGVSDRIDLGVWGGFNPASHYGAAGFDTKVALLEQGTNRPVSVSIRPSVAALVGRTDVFAANAAVDISASRRVGPLSPYAGLVASSSVAIERSSAVNLDPATTGATSAYAGVAYQWRALLVSGEIERGDVPRYGFRVGTRF